MVSDKEIARMPIQEAVRQPGGNGLASPPFQIDLNILGIYGWHNIEKGVEACICDGKLIPETKAKTEFVRLLGRRSFVRRVILKPAPLEIVSTSLTQDKLKLTLAISVKYEVNDPVYVSSLSDPIAELRNFIEGLTSECIRSENFEKFILDEGDIRMQLKQRLQTAETVKNKYIIHEVLKVIPSGDESLIEIIRKTNIAVQQSNLIEVEGENREIEASHNLAIAREKANLEELQAQWKHEREKEIRELEARSEIMKATISTLGEVAKSGIDPTKLTKEVISTLVDRVPTIKLTSGQKPILPDVQEPVPTNVRNQLEIEKSALASIKSYLEIVTFELLESQTKTNVKGAVIQMPAFQIVFKCSDSYPQEAPQVTVHFHDGRTETLEVCWIPGVSNSLAQALLVIVPQINTGIK